MNLPKILFCTLLLFQACLNNLTAQGDTVYVYYDENWEKMPKNESVYEGKAYFENNLWKMEVKSMGTLIVTTVVAYYTDSTLKTLDGSYTTWYLNGKMRTLGQYVKGKENGMWLEWNKDGWLSDSAFFDMGTKTMFAKYYYSSDGSLRSFSLTNRTDDTKQFKSYSQSGILKDESTFKGKAGEVKMYYDNGQASRIQIFNDKGRITSIKYFNIDGTEMSEKEHQKLQEKGIANLIAQMNAGKPEFRGGYGQFQIFLQRNLILPSSYRNSNHGLQEITFSFNLSANGYAQDVKMINPADPQLENAIVDMFKKMPAWDMKGLKSYGPITQTIRIQ